MNFFFTVYNHLVDFPCDDDSFCCPLTEGRRDGNNLEGGDSNSILHSYDGLVELLEGLLRSNFRFLDELDEFLEGSDSDYTRQKK